VKKPDRRLIAFLGLLVGALCGGLGPPVSAGGSAARPNASENPRWRMTLDAPEKKLASTGDF
jgi:hypothetical protein